MPVPIGITARLICDESRMSGWSSDLSHRMLAAAVGGQQVVGLKRRRAGVLGRWISNQWMIAAYLKIGSDLEASTALALKDSLVPCIADMIGGGAPAGRGWRRPDPVDQPWIVNTTFLDR